MGQIIFVPLEKLDMRYTAEWYGYFREFADKELGNGFFFVDGDKLTEEIETGSFLDVHGTNYFKASQLQKIIRMIYNKEIKSGDVLFFSDLWFPGIEMLAYIRDGAGVDFKITGILHAGVYDEWDFLSQRGMTRWGIFFEEVLLEIVDLVFVSCNFHKRLIEGTHGKQKKLVVQFLPIYLSRMAAEYRKEIRNRKQIVFPHRIVPEKQPELFEELQRQVRVEGVNYFMTQGTGGLPKHEYHKLLARSTIAVSFALQETWGIAMLEAAALGAIPLVPNRLAYKEFYPPLFRYLNHSQLVKKIEAILTYNNVLAEYQECLKDFVQDMDARGSNSIPQMMAMLKERFG